MSAISPAHLFARVARDVDPAARVWVAPALAALGFPAESATAGADVAVVLADELDETGRARSGDQVAAPRVLCVLFLAGEPRGRIVGQCANPVVTVARAYTDVAVIDVREEGLVVTELAPGVSAADVQRLAEPTLQLDPHVRPMR